MLETHSTFSNCVFTDECTVQIDSSTKYCYLKPGDQYARMRNRAKHPAKVHIWGGISTRGATALIILIGTTRIDSALYCKMIERAYVPFNHQKFNVKKEIRISLFGFAQLVQDNAPCHKSQATLRRFDELGVTHLHWPAESPDLNPIELVWGNMKTHIRKQCVRNLDDLKQSIIQYWRSLTPDVCSRYIAGMRKKLERVVEQGGRNILEGKK
ncbi:hypothetical protein Q1695_005993 [Nippostrongylus brasiliensis]|nr:hypothetical protein Q1695_005993 [Nippostrongylus brasiliensis]